MSPCLRAREALRQCLPDQLKDTTFAQVLKDDTTTKRWLAQLVKNLQEGQVTDPRGIPLPQQWPPPPPPPFPHELWRSPAGTAKQTTMSLRSWIRRRHHFFFLLLFITQAIYTLLDTPFGHHYTSALDKKLINLSSKCDGHPSIQQLFRQRIPNASLMVMWREKSVIISTLWETWMHKLCGRSL